MQEELKLGHVDSVNPGGPMPRKLAVHSELRPQAEKVTRSLQNSCRVGPCVTLENGPAACCSDVAASFGLAVPVAKLGMRVVHFAQTENNTARAGDVPSLYLDQVFSFACAHLRSCSRRRCRCSLLAFRLVGGRLGLCSPG